MEQNLAKLVTGTSYLLIFGLVAAAAFSTMIALRKIKEEGIEGFLFLVLAVFFAIAHGYILTNTRIAYFTTLLKDLNFWGWLIFILAPVLIGLYIFFALHSFLSARLMDGSVKLFFGSTLLCYLYILGPNWAPDIRGILILIWCGMWFHLELKTAP